MTRNPTIAAAQYWNSAAREFDAIYSGDNKTPLARFLDTVFRADMYRRFDWVMEKSGDVRGKTFCDVGCGSGRFAIELAQRGAASVTGIDISAEMLALAEGMAERIRLAERCEFALSDILDWNSSRTFDVTLAIGLWDYVADPRERLLNIRQMTRTRFLSAWPRLWTWRAPVRKVRLQYMRGCPVYFYRKPQIVNRLENAGFQIQSIETIGKLFCVDATPVPVCPRTEPVRPCGNRAG